MTRAHACLSVVRPVKWLPDFPGVFWRILQPECWSVSLNLVEAAFKTTLGYFLRIYLATRQGTSMDHSIGDGIIVAALAARLFGYLYLKYRTRIRRLELVHQERLIAMEKDFPLPELPMDPPQIRTPPNPHVPLILGIVLLMFGTGCMIALRFTLEEAVQRLWITPLPVVLIGLGLILVHRLTQPRGV